MTFHPALHSRSWSPLSASARLPCPLAFRTLDTQANWQMSGQYKEAMVIIPSILLQVGSSCHPPLKAAATREQLLLQLQPPLVLITVLSLPRAADSCTSLPIIGFPYTWSSVHSPLVKLSSGYTFSGTCHQLPAKGWTDPAQNISLNPARCQPRMQPQDTRWLLSHARTSLSFSPEAEMVREGETRTQASCHSEQGSCHSAPFVPFRNSEWFVFSTSHSLLYYFSSILRCSSF